MPGIFEVHEPEHQARRHKRIEGPALQTQHHAAIATTGLLMAADRCFCFAS
jgi:hypothetical protein